MNRIALALALLAAPAGAASVTPFHPGHSPCRDACSLEWAAGAAGVDVGDTSGLELPAGTLIEWMSYARDGDPHGYDTAMVTVEPHVVQAYPLGGGRWFAQFWECGNWAVVRHVPAIPAWRDLPEPMPILAGWVAPWGWGGWGYYTGGGSNPPGPPGPPGPPCDCNPPGPPIVPAPASLPLLVFATAVLAAYWRRKT